MRKALGFAVLGVLAVAGAGAWWHTRRPPPERCLVRDLGAHLGRDHLLLGGQMEGSILRLEPFDVRYHYIAGGVPDAPCTDCRACSVDGVSCKNPSPCGWWGCWQRDDQPPGQWVGQFLAETERHRTIPMITWYQWNAVAGRVDEGPEIAALADPGKVRRYLDDFHALAVRIGAGAAGPVIVHLEPDLWGYARKANPAPHQVPVAVSAAEEPLCKGLPDDVTGLARCLSTIARAEIPHVVVALHASAWDRHADVMINRSPDLDVVAHARATAAYLQALGAAPDLLVVEMNHRDAGFNNAWWDPTDQQLPDIAQALTWARALSEAMGVPHLWWQVPYGNLSLDDTCGRYRDNRLDYFFSHPDRFADGTTLGIAFGAGTACMTTAETDGGHFAQQAARWYAGPRPRLCP